MAGIGAKYPVFLDTSSSSNTGIVLGKLVSADLSITLAEGEIYGDDALQERLSEFVSGTLTLESTNLDDNTMAALYGITAESNGELVFNKDDDAPHGCLGFYQTLLVGGEKKYRAIFLHDAQAVVGNMSAQTRGSNITFAADSVTFNIKTNDSGDWKAIQTFDTEAAAIAYINGKCGITTSGGGSSGGGSSGDGDA